MRLIDADELKTAFPTCDNSRPVLVASVRATIDHMPTIEPERKTGRWIPVMNGRGGHCCNRCNGYAPSYMNGDEHLSDFCPYCGAYMGGEQDE